MQQTESAEQIGRYSRQASLVPHDRIAEVGVTVVGVGAIGRSVALQLSAMGVQRLGLVDFDHVEEVNVVTQGYAEGQIGMAKVAATASDCLELNSAMDIDVTEGRFRRSLRPDGAVFMCVDSIETRRLVWEGVRGSAQFVVDGRMAAECCRVIVAERPASDEYYETTLFRGEDAYRGACTARATYYCASVAAGLMSGAYAKWLRGAWVERDVTLNLLSMELIVESTER